jgi:hypothetical protein
MMPSKYAEKKDVLIVHAAEMMEGYW